MDCVNHPGMNAEAYCQNCGKAMCATCARREPTGEVMCAPCWTAWQAARAPYAAAYAPAGRCPSPALAAILGFIPGVGAMFNGQFVKGFLHVIIFAVLASMADVYSMFGLLVAAWVFYQVFDAFHTARAICEGQPLPDPLGLNELVNTLGREYRRTQNAPPPPPAGYAPPVAGFVAGYPPPPATGYPPAMPPVPGVPPAPPLHWRRREPVAAIILIAMGVLFLLGQFSWRAMHFAWPVLLIGLGVWLVVRRMKDASYVAPAPPSAAPQASDPHAREQHSSDEDPQGGMR